MIRINTDNFGTVLRELRLKKGLTQEELARGICSRQYIYLVETGKRMLSAYALQQISFKLGIDLSKYVLLSGYEDPISIEQSIKKMDLYRRTRDFSSLSKLIDEIEHSNIKKDIMLFQYLQWNKSICQYEVEKEPNRALATIVSAIKVTHRSFNFNGKYNFLKTHCITQIEFSIFTSLAKILFNQGKKEEAILIVSNLKYNLQNHTHDYKNEPIYISLLYNLSLYLIHLNKFEESLKHINELIDVCNEQDQLFLLGEGMYHKSVVLNKLGKTKEAKQMAQDALSFFRLRGNEEFVKIIAKEIEEQYGEES